MAASFSGLLVTSSILKNRLREVIVGSNRIFAISLPHYWFSADSSSSDEETTSAKISEKKEKLNSKLSTLISSLKVESSIAPEKSAITLNLAKPRNRRKTTENVDQPNVEKQLPFVISSVKIDENLVAAAKAVASSLSGDKEIIESELLQTLKAHAEETEEAKSVSTRDVSKVFVGMKIDRKRQEKKIPSYTAVDQPHYQYETLPPQEINDVATRMQSQWKRKPASASDRIDLHSAPILDIFNISGENIKTDFPKNKIWDRLAEHELQLLVKHPARNGFEEMIRWTEEGKLWVFPIDNEYGLDEKKVSFHEHIFLDHLLEGFPEKGPIRHFMELVITGLSKNPYISVERKKEHVEWYRTYFEDKKEMLKETGVLMS